MNRDKMKVFTTVMLALSFLMGELTLSAPALAYASTSPANPVASTPQSNARWVRCNVDGDMDADDWCWVPNARVFFPEGKLVVRNGFVYIVRNGRLVLRNRLILRNRRLVLPGGLVVRNGYVMRNGRVVGIMNNSGSPLYYYP